MYFPKREELSFRVVLALPKDSRMGLVAKICLSTSLASSSDFALVRFSESELTEAKYLMMSFAYGE
jgi:hypothetical protein